MLRIVITDQVWSRLVPILKKFRIHFSVKIRIFLEAVFWKLKTGAPWRDLPSEYGPYSTIFNKFNRWSKNNLWQKIFLNIRGELDNEWNFIDSTVVKAHQHATCRFESRKENIGKSVGGNSTKIHMLSDAHGNPIHFILSGGQMHDSKAALDLIDVFEGEYFIGDRAYNSEELRNKIKEKDAQPIIPKKSNSLDKTNPGFDKYLYKIRHLAENLFARLKHFRSIATRYEKKSNNFASLIYLACTLIWSKI